jgi:two-component system, OmpR family, phosphate regulon response regulator PhoB
MIEKSPTVLVIEDDRDLAELMACFLAQGNVRPIMAANGTDGLQQARALRPSLVLCDSCLPGMDGLEVIETLRSDPGTATIPIVLMSGLDSARFDGSGANVFLPKPFHMMEMVKLVQGLVARPSSGTSALPSNLDAPSNVGRSTLNDTLVPAG